MLANHQFADVRDQEPCRLRKRKIYALPQPMPFYPIRARAWSVMCRLPREYQGADMIRLSSLFFVASTNADLRYKISYQSP